MNNLNVVVLIKEESVDFLGYKINAKLKTFQFVPLQDFSRPWTDADLYAKYGLTDDEIQFIESMIKPME